MRIVFMGSPEFVVFPLKLLAFNRHEVVAVYTPPDRPAGRGRKLIAPPVKTAARSLNLPLVQVSNLKAHETIKQIAECRPEAIVVAAFGQILPQEVLDIPCYGCLNLHPSLLPKFRGPAPVPAAILAGNSFTGMSIMRLDAGMDTGPVFSRAQIPIHPFDDSESLLHKLFEIGARMLNEVLAVLPSGTLIPEPQVEAEASYTREIQREDGNIDWELPAVGIWRRVRAYRPWPAAYTYWAGKQVKILEAAPEQAAGGQPGRVVILGEEECPQQRMGIMTGQGILEVLRLQIEGKQSTSASEFLRGHREFVGTVLG